MSSALACDRLSLRTSAPRARTILNDISVTIEPGEFVALIGPSGAGKSVLLGCLAGLDHPTTGSVTLLGRDPAHLARNSRMNRERLARFRLKHMALVLQEHNLMASLTCRENVVLPLRLRRGVSPRNLRSAADAALAEVDMEWAAECLPAPLSGGERQRVALARMLATPAEIVVADEPTAALDAASSQAAVELLRRRAASGSAVFMVTHDLDAAVAADRTLVLAAGSLVGEARRADRAQLAAWLGAPVDASPAETPRTAP